MFFIMESAINLHRTWLDAERHEAMASVKLLGSQVFRVHA
ncbi:hypothetical protein BSU04_19000 [Caballeronia sordidicola]|uniref:Uncharacterized protein n=1 Tax=Caballeronia sordidicola TaxID=196367 RepID=A0A226X176_CABSO|nr:hypothetical protein BSU04_19000 [Caballeronia sordidicola]